jgi:signal peptidase
VRSLKAGSSESAEVRSDGNVDCDTSMTTLIDESSYLKLSLAIDVLRSAGEARLAVGGSSMLPSIWPGDVLQIHRVAAADLAVDDIVVFARENRLVVHRILSLNRECDDVVLITRGDRSPKSDSPVSASELLGKVKTLQRGGRKLLPHRTRWTRIASWILLRSELCTRVLLYLALIRRDSLALDPIWVS